MNESIDALKDLPLPQQLLHWAKVRPDEVALRQKEFGVWQPVTWAEYARQARWFGLGLLQLGLAPGQCVAVLSENCREWAYAELGTALVGGITAGVYPTSPEHEVEYLLALADAPIIVCEDQEQLDKVLAIRPRLPQLRLVVAGHARALHLETFGDPSRPELLRAARADQAEVFVLATDDPEVNIRTARIVRRMFPHLKIVARARNRQHAFRLMDLNVDDVVRETLHSSLEMARLALEELGIEPATAAERVEKFRVHDAELLKTQYLVYDDDAALMQGAKEAFVDLERLFEADTNSETSPRN